jgi:hypothetical protein
MLILAQFVLIHFASDRTPVQPRTVSSRPGVQLPIGGRSEMLALTDPTLFARAQQDEFSAAAWMAISAVDFTASRTNQAPRWLMLAPAQLGSHFREFIRTNAPVTLGGGMLTPPTSPPLRIGPLAEVLPVSTFQVEGDLARRALLHFSPPPAQTNSEVLQPSEVQLRVDARGNPVSVLLMRSSGLKLADQLAVALAWDTQFAPDREALAQSRIQPAAGETSGTMIFFWRTEPANGPSTPPLNPR